MFVWNWKLELLKYYWNLLYFSRIVHSLEKKIVCGKQSYDLKIIIYALIRKEKNLFNMFLRAEMNLLNWISGPKALISGFVKN